MSKEKPEIGDVWVRPKGKKYYITDIGSHFITIVPESIMGYDFPKDYFKTEFTYVGKSKVNINNLFEVVDEESK